MAKILIVFLVVILSGCTPASESPEVNSNEIQNTSEEAAMDVDELKIETTLEGSGEEAKTGDTVSVHYTGTLLDGTKFDSSVDRGTPFEFTLGQNMVIQGWEQGIAGMKVGEKRTLTIPSALAYGPMGRPPVIPQSAGLIFEVELLGIN